MRISALTSFVTFLSSTSAALNGFSAFVNPLDYRDFPRHLLKRQGCPGGYTNCRAFGNSDACCPTDQSCAQDTAGNIACCPQGAACTGIVDGAVGTSARTSTGPVVLGGTPAAPSNSALSLPSQTASLSVTSGFLFPSPPTTDAPNSPQSTVAGAVFPFVYIPTTFGNAAECSSYATSCSQQYQSCLGALNGGVNGVTVSGAGVGITVEGASTAIPGASSICNSLSSEACYGLQTEICPQYGGGTASASGGLVVNGGGMHKAAGCPGIMYAAGAGAIAGVAGGVL